MNPLLRILAVAGLLTAAHTFAAEANALVAADAFEGKVSLAITTEKGRTQTLNYSMKGQKLRMDIETEGKVMATIMDLNKLEMLVLMPEQSMYMVMPIKKPVEQAMAKQGESTADIEVTGKTDTILGYKCEQLLVKDKGTVTEMWVASGLGTFMGMGSSGGGGGGAVLRRGGGPTAATGREGAKGSGGVPLGVVLPD